MAITDVHFLHILEKTISALPGPDISVNNQSFSSDVDAIYHRQLITVALL